MILVDRPSRLTIERYSLVRVDGQTKRIFDRQLGDDSGQNLNIRFLVLDGLDLQLSFLLGTNRRTPYVVTSHYDLSSSWLSSSASAMIW